jgi:pimeloyl-ACP methyl ester carboxylesterase
LVGPSLGGFVVQDFAYRFPTRLRALAVIGSTDLAKKQSILNKLLFRVFPGLLSRISLLKWSIEMNCSSTKVCSSG